MTARISTRQLTVAMRAAEQRAYQTALGLASTKAANTAAASQPVNASLTEISELAPSDDDILQRKAGEWTSRTPAQVKADLALTRADVGLTNAVEWVAVPATATSAGTAGQAAYESGWLYVCVAANTWQRAVMATWV